MTDFGLSDGYQVLNGLNQSEMFSSLLWRIFYDLLLCKVKKQESLCDYWIDTKFVAKLDRINNVIGSSQTATQFILDVASGFFAINDISINNDKTRVQNTVLRISRLPISIAKCGVSYKYLGIFLSTDGLSKPSLAKAQSDIKFFSNMSIVGYHTQFSLVFSSICWHWDAMIKKNFKSKTGLFQDFPNEMLYHPLLYDLKTFEQIQAEAKSASVINFLMLLGLLVSFLDTVRLWVSPSNNFLAEIVHIFLNNNISLVNNLPSAFFNLGRYSVFGVLGSSLYYDQVTNMTKSWTDKHSGIGRNWISKDLCLLASSGNNPMVDVNDVLIFSQFSNVKNSLLEIWSNSIFVFTDGSLKGLGSTDVAGGAVTFFPEIKLGIEIKIVGLLSLTMNELQAVALALECVLSFCSVEVCLDSQAALDACVLELKIDSKEHFCGLVGNNCRDVLAGISAHSSLLLPTNVCEHFMMANGTLISGNIQHFVHDVFRFVNHTHWEIGPSSRILCGFSVHSIDWVRTMAVWHLNLGMLSGSTNRASVNLHSYFMKTVYGRLSITVRKRLYNKKYSGILCLHCGEVEFSDYVFTCSKKAVPCMVLEILLSCVHNIGLYALLCKGFVLIRWFKEAVFKSWFRADMEKNNLVSDSGVLLVTSCGSAQGLSDSMVRLIGTDDFFGVSFGFCKSYLFFFGLDDLATVLKVYSIALINPSD
ncbi:hypothetical protein G9A89_005181 [Geosiphon pyriformis]|nr:hypothetical protein G9A89_005181 [Geosiphon pyriformis]